MLVQAHATVATAAHLLDNYGAPPLPPPCQPFNTKGGQPVECTVELTAGYTYVLYTDCASVRGDTQLTLRDPSGVDVAFNDGFPFCPGDTSASLVEFYVECGQYGTSAKFTLLQDCFEDTDCGGSTVVEYSKKEPPVDCGRGPFTCTKQDATCEALGDLYYATNGSGWNNNGGWSSASVGIPTDYCKFWQYTTTGIPMCNGAGVLTSLWFFANNLRGTIPATLASLTELTFVDFAANQLSGPLTTLTSLSRLQWIGLEGNLLSGSIPAAFGSLTGLTGLWLDQNQLSGSLPATLGSLTGLQTLRLWNNKLSGSIPPALASMTALTFLQLANSGLCGFVPMPFNNHIPTDGTLPAC